MVSRVAVEPRKQNERSAGRVGLSAAVPRTKGDRAISGGKKRRDMKLAAQFGGSGKAATYSPADTVTRPDQMNEHGHRRTSGRGAEGNLGGLAAQVPRREKTSLRLHLAAATKNSSASLW